MATPPICMVATLKMLAVSAAPAGNGWLNRPPFLGDCSCRRCKVQSLWRHLKTVLLVEDNSDDVFVMKMACQRSGIPHQLKVAEDGDAAVDYLSGAGKFKDRAAHPFPDVVFLDIKMPKRDGHEVLQWIREQPAMKNLPVVMLTGSVQPSDVDRAFELGVTSYLKKVACPAEFGQAVRIILKYWLDLHITPR